MCSFAKLYNERVMVNMHYFHVAMKLVFLSMKLEYSGRILSLMQFSKSRDRNKNSTNQPLFFCVMLHLVP